MIGELVKDGEGILIEGRMLLIPDQSANRVITIPERLMRYITLNPGPGTRIALHMMSRVYRTACAWLVSPHGSSIAWKKAGNRELYASILVLLLTQSTYLSPALALSRRRT